MTMEADQNHIARDAIVCNWTKDVIDASTALRMHEGIARSACPVVSLKPCLLFALPINSLGGCWQPDDRKKEMQQMAAMYNLSLSLDTSQEPRDIPGTELLCIDRRIPYAIGISPLGLLRKYAKRHSILHHVATVCMYEFSSSH